MADPAIDITLTMDMDETSRERRVIRIHAVAGRGTDEHLRTITQDERIIDDSIDHMIRSYGFRPDGIPLTATDPACRTTENPMLIIDGPLENPETKPEWILFVWERDPANSLYFSKWRGPLKRMLGNTRNWSSVRKYGITVALWTLDAELLSDKEADLRDE